MRIILRTMDLPGKSAALYRPRKSPIALGSFTSLIQNTGPTALHPIQRLKQLWFKAESYCSDNKNNDAKRTHSIDWNAPRRIRTHSFNQWNAFSLRRDWNQFSLSLQCDSALSVLLKDTVSRPRLKPILLVRNTRALDHTATTLTLDKLNYLQVDRFQCGTWCHRLKCLPCSSAQQFLPEGPVEMDKGKKYWGKKKKKTSKYLVPGIK